MATATTTPQTDRGLAWSELWRFATVLKDSGISSPDAVLSYIVACFLKVCKTHFEGHFALMGFENPEFHSNDQHHHRGNKAFDKLSHSLKNLMSSNACLSVVLHGTASPNIASILKSGLNANLRLVQAHGPGEYFATTPITPLEFCKTGLELLVFLVILPDVSKRPKSHPDFVVVEDNNHQLPLGTLKFTGVDKVVLNQVVKGPKTIFQAADSIVSSWTPGVAGRPNVSSRNPGMAGRPTFQLTAKWKAQIFQLTAKWKAQRIITALHRGEFVLASHLWSRDRRSINMHLKTAISFHVHQSPIDSAFISHYFENLPKPVATLPYL